MVPSFIFSKAASKGFRLVFRSHCSHRKTQSDIRIHTKADHKERLIHSISLTSLIAALQVPVYTLSLPNALKILQVSNFYYVICCYTTEINIKTQQSWIEILTILTWLKRWMERSTSKETATKMVNTVATDHVGVKASDLVSCTASDILK